MTRHRPDSVDDLVIGDLVADAGEAGVASISEDGLVLLHIAAQGQDQVVALRDVEGTEVHGRSPYSGRARGFWASSLAGSCDASSASTRYTPRSMVAVSGSTDNTSPPRLTR